MSAVKVCAFANAQLRFDTVGQSCTDQVAYCGVGVCVYFSVIDLSPFSALAVLDLRNNALTDLQGTCRLAACLSK